ncbi:MAG: hypothetical protein WCS52_07285 [bacterium]
MATTHYCNIHGEYNVYGESSGGCPACQNATERSENDNEKLLKKLSDISDQTVDNERVSREAAERIAYLSNNPGDYICPTCKMRSLKNDALRCPKCCADVTLDFWKNIRSNEKLAEDQKRHIEEARRKWLASPEYAETLRQATERKKLDFEAEAERQRIAADAEVERRKLIVEANVTRQVAQSKNDDRRKSLGKTRMRLLLGGGVAGNVIGFIIFHNPIASVVGIIIGVALGRYLGIRFYKYD